MSTDTSMHVSMHTMHTYLCMCLCTHFYAHVYIHLQALGQCTLPHTHFYTMSIPCRCQSLYACLCTCPYTVHVSLHMSIHCTRVSAHVYTLYTCLCTCPYTSLYTCLCTCPYTVRVSLRRLREHLCVCQADDEQDDVVRVLLFCFFLLSPDPMEPWSVSPFCSFSKLGGWTHHTHTQARAIHTNASLSQLAAGSKNVGR